MPSSALKIINPPTRAVRVATLVSTGVAWLSTLVSPVSLFSVSFAALLVLHSFPTRRSSDLAWLGVNGSEVAVPVPPPELTTALVLVKIAALPHAAAFQSYSVMVLLLLRVPNPPARFAVSLIDPPTRAVGVATVVRVGVAWLTTLVSPGSLQAVAIAALFVSPL